MLGKKITGALFVSTLLSFPSAAQGIKLNNFSLQQDSYYKKSTLRKEDLSSTKLRLSGVSGNTAAIPASIQAYTYNSGNPDYDELLACEETLMQLWDQYRTECRKTGKKVDYKELYSIWQQDKFCGIVLDKMSLELFFNFIAPAQPTAVYYLNQVIVRKYAYPGTKGTDEFEDWMNGPRFQKENGFVEVTLTPKSPNDTITLDDPLIIEKQGTLTVKLASTHYQSLTPGSLQQGSYVIQLQFLFESDSGKKYVKNTPIFLVKI